MLVVSLTAMLVGCDQVIPYQETVEFGFDNRTDSVLCYYVSAEEAGGATCRQELEPQAETDAGYQCGTAGSKDVVQSNPVTVILTIKEGSRLIYSRTALCGEWPDTERRFIIEQEGDEFIVTDSLPPSLPAP